MKKERKKYDLSLQEFFLFDNRSKINLLKIHGKVIYFDFPNSELIVIVYFIYDFHVKVIRLMTTKKVIEISPIINGEDFSTYLNLKGMNMQLFLS
ncbi:MAG: hypothetical protein ABJG68_14875 [Crocinitomicaceae bacterium]